MLRPWRPLALAAALSASVVTGVATAQTVVVTNAPPGSTVELVLNAATIESAIVKPGGDATLAVNLSKHAGKAETAAHVYVDVCGSLRRVVLVEQGQSPAPPGSACARKEFAELFALRSVTTLVVDVAEARMALWVRQGPAPVEWLRPKSEAAAEPARARKPSPKGLIVSGGGGFMSFRDTVALACGNVTDCAGKDSRSAFSAGAAYWFTQFAAAEAAYIRPTDVTADGRGNSFRFNSELDAHVLTVGGKAGFPIGRMRFYGQGGMNYHRATFTTTQTVEDYTVTVDGVDQTIKGGTQTFGLRTAGWGWQFGGGGEVWVAPRLAIYGEAGYARLKGATVDAAEGAFDERVIFILAGARVRIGR